MRPYGATRSGSTSHNPTLRSGETARPRTRHNVSRLYHTAPDLAALPHATRLNAATRNITEHSGETEPNRTSQGIAALHGPPAQSGSTRRDETERQHKPGRDRAAKPNDTRRGRAAEQHTTERNLSGMTGYDCTEQHVAAKRDRTKHYRAAWHHIT